MVSKLNNICSWVNWKRVIELIVAFLIVRIIFILVTPHYSYWPIHAPAAALFCFSFGVLSGVGLAFSKERRRSDCRSRVLRLIKLLKDS